MKCELFKIWIVSLFATIQIFSFSTHASDCALLEPWLSKGHQVLAPDASHEDRISQSELEYQLRVQTGNSLQKIYVSGALDPAILDSCLQSLPDRGNFLETFYYILFSTSIQKLERSNAPAIQSLMDLFRQKYGSGLPVFRVTGSFQEQDATPLPAGFHRATGSIYMDFAKINPDDWLIIFVHETLHALDDQIFVGVEGYATPGLAQHFVELSKTCSNVDQLSLSDKTSLDQWLTFGMDRGLLAEYRAWSATFIIYEEGKARGLWSSRPWLEEVLSQMKVGESTPQFTYRYLDEHSQDPTDQIFSNSLISSALTELRHELRSSKTPPPLFGLEPILQ